jgi:hypothetical protein
LSVDNFEHATSQSCDSLLSREHAHTAVMGVTGRWSSVAGRQSGRAAGWARGAGKAKPNVQGKSIGQVGVLRLALDFVSRSAQDDS